MLKLKREFNMMFVADPKASAWKTTFMAADSMIMAAMNVY